MRCSFSAVSISIRFPIIAPPQLLFLCLSFREHINVPEDFGITGRLWTLGRTREYIRKEFHKAINERTLSDYMKRWGMSCQRPAKRARKQNPQGI